ncbi:tRNA uridine-5-carboxymethylaminomethyl(34) synthesis GTPase MnmE [Paenibacillus sp.]|uniref:tRNA uridine-5-carboxymethylaminomethyl(34) synthesis GTPase MnmE n=1 Tax=Paenibacillus sp. TaxID=58172 RepID=UPI002D4B961D|nr:tRNA uridine-5-carboxymethylaminomethyl(34) synthesis GTPase MnmE [Paenibacillus sp.]HZG84899.1 tRNA uridine-5-carboxymethylaminomethyl(34) synthesis GTPase MnmE [Paenibacillus sp.]
MTEDTIAAIATPLGEGGIAVIRISGPRAVDIAESVFRSKVKLTKAESHTVHYGHVVSPATGERIEEALATVMRAPRSYTAEDVVEVSCHGGIVSVKKVLDAILDRGARLAEPGEFTKRAFLNGRIDLAQAEAVIDLIRSKSDRAFTIALKQAEGVLSRRVKALRHVLIETMAHIEVNIDYPEHDVEELTNAFIREKCEAALEEIETMLRTAEEGKLLREGIETAIVGKPNVGKSSLLNALAQDNRAIVTDIPGTTRDVIEEYVTVGGIPLKLLDTAGIRETSDVVERIGVERSRSAIASADLILFVVNGHEELSEEENALMDELAGRQTIVIVNKMDLEPKIDWNALYERVPEERVVRLSAREGEGLDRLGKAIGALFFSGSIESSDITYVSNVRHIHLLKQAKGALLEALDGVAAQMPIDMVQIDVRRAWEQLGEMIGDAVSDSLIDQIFSQFCLGK